MKHPRRVPERTLGKAVVIYARTATIEQDEAVPLVCDSQIAEMRAFCRAQGWVVIQEIREEGVSNRWLGRDGLTKLRHLVRTRQVEGIVCKSIDRLAQAKGLVILQNEFQANGVDLLPIFNPPHRRIELGNLFEVVLANTTDSKRRWLR